MKHSVTIAIPVYNEEKCIDMLLGHINKMKFKFNLKEILVVCSGCTDGSTGAVRRWMGRNKKIRIVIEKIRKGKYSAMNKLLANARGNIIVFIYADVIPKKNSFDLLVKHFENPKTGAVTGRIIPIQQGDSLSGYFQQFVCDLHHEISLSNPKMGDMWAVRKGLIRRIPKNIINDDFYIPSEISKTHEVIYEPKSLHIMFREYTFGDYVKQRRRLAQGYIQLSKMGIKNNISIVLVMKLIAKRIINEPRNIFQIAFAITTELYCEFLALYNTALGNIEYKWEAVR